MVETPDGYGRLELTKFHAPSGRGGDLASVSRRLGAGSAYGTGSVQVVAARSATRPARALPLDLRPTADSNLAYSLTVRCRRTLGGHRLSEKARLLDSVRYGRCSRPVCGRRIGYQSRPRNRGR